MGSKSNVEQFVARFDHVKYLRDSQIEILNAQREEKGLTSKLTTGDRNPESLGDYVVKGPAAKAYSQPNSVLLIDEIDKAPREFPNDLLYALSHRKFIMPESGEVIEVSEEDMPAIVITSNREQELPTAFKGRCIYHYIDFPDKEVMGKIIEKHHPGMDDKVVRVALDAVLSFETHGSGKSAYNKRNPQLAQVHERHCPAGCRRENRRPGRYRCPHKNTGRYGKSEPNARCQWFYIWISIQLICLTRYQKNSGPMV